MQLARFISEDTKKRKEKGGSDDAKSSFRLCLRPARAQEKGKKRGNILERAVVSPVCQKD